MKSKNLILLLAIVLLTSFGCITMQPNIYQQSSDLQQMVEKLRSLSSETVEVKRTIAIAILENWAFDGGTWTVALELSRIKPTDEMQTSVRELTKLAFKLEALQAENKEMSSHELGRSITYFVVVSIGAIEFGMTSLLPRITQLLALF